MTTLSHTFLDQNLHDSRVNVSFLILLIVITEMALELDGHLPLHRQMHAWPCLFPLLYLLCLLFFFMFNQQLTPPCLFNSGLYSKLKLHVLAYLALTTGVRLLQSSPRQVDRDVGLALAPVLKVSAPRLD